MTLKTRSMMHDGKLLFVQALAIIAFYYIKNTCLRQENNFKVGSHPNPLKKACDFFAYSPFLSSTRATAMAI